MNDKIDSFEMAYEAPATDEYILDNASAPTAEMEVPFDVELITEISVDEQVDIIGKAAFSGLTAAGMILFTGLFASVIINILKKA